MPFIYQTGNSGGSGSTAGGIPILPTFNVNEDMELIANSVDPALFNFALNDNSELEVTTYGNN